MKETLCLPMMKVVGFILHAVWISFSESTHKPITDKTDHLIPDMWGQNVTLHQITNLTLKKVQSANRQWMQVYISII